MKPTTEELVLKLENFMFQAANLKREAETLEKQIGEMLNAIKDKKDTDIATIEVVVPVEPLARKLKEQHFVNAYNDVVETYNEIYKRSCRKIESAPTKGTNTTYECIKSVLGKEDQDGDTITSQSLQTAVRGTKKWAKPDIALDSIFRKGNIMSYIMSGKVRANGFSRQDEDQETITF